MMRGPVPLDMEDLMREMRGSFFGETAEGAAGAKVGTEESRPGIGSESDGLRAASPEKISSETCLVSEDGRPDAEAAVRRAAAEVRAARIGTACAWAAGGFRERAWIIAGCVNGINGNGVNGNEWRFPDRGPDRGINGINGAAVPVG